MNEELLQILKRIEELIEWHCDLEADENDQSPEDMHAHCNGLAMREIEKARKVLAQANPPHNDLTIWVECDSRDKPRLIIGRMIDLAKRTGCNVTSWITDVKVTVSPTTDHDKAVEDYLKAKKENKA